MEYANVIPATFIDRPNRFIAHVDINGTIETVHVKNTGRCKELLLPGAEVYVTAPGNPNRKTRYDLVTVRKGDSLINIDSQAPNRVVREWLEAQGFDLIRPEYAYGSSRIDFYMERGAQRYLMEVKGCTLEIDGIGYLPYAPTDRGVKHLRELIKAAASGYKCFIAFAIQMEGIKEVRANVATHPEFGVALDEAAKAGVRILPLQCHVTQSSIEIITASAMMENNA